MVLAILNPLIFHVISNKDQLVGFYKEASSNSVEVSVSLYISLESFAILTIWTFSIMIVGYLSIHVELL